MNVTPEVLERLRRLARSLQNKESTKTNEDNDKKEVEQKGKDNEKVNLATNGTGLSGKMKHFLVRYTLNRLSFLLTSLCQYFGGNSWPSFVYARPQIRSV